MKEYTITWEVEDLKAKSPIEALFRAVELFERQRSTFLVTDQRTGKQRTFPDPRSFDRDDWEKAVVLGETDLGFIDWIEAQQEAKAQAAAETLKSLGISTD